MEIKHRKILFVACFFTLFSFCESQKNKCVIKDTCGACIRDADCIWCNSPFIENSKLQRCQYFKKSEDPNWCASKNIINPQPKGKIIRNLPLQSSTTARSDAIQITPQRVKLTLRPGQEYEVKFKYATAHDYPVDLYYIMDLSASMEVHRKKLSELGDLLSDTMRKLTKNFKLGFGSFVDKVAMPFTSTVPSSLSNPCPNNPKPCDSPYSFKNHLSLTEDAQKFTFEVGQANVSGNLDSPEGGFEALMQAIVCQKEIGWRPKARHLIVLSTDDYFHIAGDGKLVGVVLPNDGECHMENNEYTHGTIIDYPSIAHIASKVKEHNINLIFALAKSTRVKDILGAYNFLKNRIEESSVGLLTEDSSNVVDLVKDVYDKIVDSVKISDNANSNIEIKYYSSCRENTVRETNECTNLKVGVVVDFKAVIKVLSCPENPNMRTQTFEIKPGALSESLTVEIEMICNCDCEKQEVKNARECHNSGSLQCGICTCNDGNYGTNCECDAGSTSAVEDISNCRISNTSDICSGLGTCKCNKCDCQQRMNENEQIYGKFCECTNYSCQRIVGALCSNNGNCDCGTCKCFAGFDGDACERSNSTDTCLANNGKVCNDHGTCNNGKCDCEKSFYGRFCEECLGCKAQRCNVLKDCVECTIHETGIYDTKDSCQGNCSHLNIQEIDYIDDESSEKEKICIGIDNKNCVFDFKYYYDEMDQTVLRIFGLKDKDCPTEVNVAALVGGIIGSILLAGLIALLLWKGFTTVHDRREYAKFENERKNAKWNRGENPLFKNPTSTFSNPTFGSGSN